MNRIRIGRSKLYFVRGEMDNAIRAYAEEKDLKLVYHDDEIVMEGKTEQLYAALYDISQRWTLLIV